MYSRGYSLSIEFFVKLNFRILCQFDIVELLLNWFVFEMDLTSKLWRFRFRKIFEMNFEYLKIWIFEFLSHLIIEILPIIPDLINQLLRNNKPWTDLLYLFFCFLWDNSSLFSNLNKSINSFINLFFSMTSRKLNTNSCFSYWILGNNLIKKKCKMKKWKKWKKTFWNNRITKSDNINS